MDSRYGWMALAAKCPKRPNDFAATRAKQIGVAVEMAERASDVAGKPERYARGRIRPQIETNRRRIQEKKTLNKDYGRLRGANDYSFESIWGALNGSSQEAG